MLPLLNYMENFVSRLCLIQHQHYMVQNALFHYALFGNACDPNEFYLYSLVMLVYESLVYLPQRATTIECNIRLEIYISHLRKFWDPYWNLPKML